MAVTINDSGITFNDGSLQPTALTTGTQTIAGAKTFSSPVTMGSAQMPTPSGAAPIYGCRAWVNFVGSTGTINASGNVTSVTRNGVGDYTVNFTTAMPDTNYCIQGAGRRASATPLIMSMSIPNTAAYDRTVSSFRFQTRADSTAAEDPLDFYVAVFR